MTDDDFTRRERDFLRRFPQLFQADASSEPLPYGGFAVGAGWTPILDDLFRDLATLEAGPSGRLTVIQVKEKFGALRVYIHRGTAAAMEAIDRASRRSATICEFCGAPSAIRDRKGWFTTQCDACVTDGQRARPGTVPGHR